MPGQTPSYFLKSVLPGLVAAIFLSASPAHDGVNKTAIYQPLNTIATPPLAFMARSSVPDIPRIELDDSPLDVCFTTVGCTAPILADSTATDVVLSQPHSPVTNITTQDLPLVTPSTYDARSFVFMEHIREHRKSYAIGVPLLFLPALWIIAHVFCHLRRAMSSAHRIARMLVKHLLYVSMEYISELPVVVAFALAVRSSLPPTPGTHIGDKAVGPFYNGLQLAFADIVCILYILAELGFIDGPQHHSTVFFISFIGLLGFLRGYGFSNTDNFNSRSISYPCTQQSNRSSGNISTTLDESGLTAYYDASEGDSVEHKEARWSRLQSKAFQFAKENSTSDDFSLVRASQVKAGALLEAKTGSKDVTDTCTSGYLVPPAGFPQGAKYSSTPRRVPTGNDLTGIPPSPSTWNPVDLPSLSNVDLCDPSLPHINVSSASDTSVAKSTEDIPNATYALDREWASYGGSNDFIRGIANNAASTSRVNEENLKLGGGYFINEDGVHTLCSRATKRAQPPVLQKLDELLAKKRKI